MVLTLRNEELKKSFDRAWIYREKYGDCDITSRDK